MTAFKSLLALVAGLLAFAGQAQPAQKVMRIGYLTPTAQVQRETVFREALAKLGWVEGRNVSIEYRNANGSFEKLPALADELARLQVDVIVSVVTQASVAAKNATPTIPIVVVGVADPLGSKLVTSLSRPGGNLTGNSIASVDVIGKQLELLRELRPGVTRVALLSNPANRVYNAQQLDEVKAAAAKLGVVVSVAEARTPDAFDTAFRSMANARAEALLILGDPMFAPHADRIARLSLDQRLPAVGPSPDYAEGGALATYGATWDEMYRRAAVYVDRILRGVKPADLPIERPTRYDLVLNLKTAKALGITIPSMLVSRADRVIQ